ncbi:MAG: DUF975 family protein [Clostridia bacterium]|nr:DUF975 family protein [Clostridia bacterium]
MKFAADFRRIAREALRGRWGIAVIAGLLASLLGAIGSSGPELNIEMNDGQFQVWLSVAGQNIITTDGRQGLLRLFGGLTLYIVILAIVTGIILFVLGSVIEVGYCKFNLDLTDRREKPEIGTMFGYFSFWQTTAVSRFLQTVYVFLWSLLFIIPGIMAGYSYAMTGYILAENPHLTASEAIERSKQMMYGNRWRLFCLQISFIGWSILSSLLTFGIGDLWLTPYRQSASAAFYREISGTEPQPETINVENEQ